MGTSALIRRTVMGRPNAPSRPAAMSALFCSIRCSASRSLLLAAASIIRKYSATKPGAHRPRVLTVQITHSSLAPRRIISSRFPSVANTASM
jgi:hypothetical protein